MSFLQLFVNYMKISHSVSGTKWAYSNIIIHNSITPHCLCLFSHFDKIASFRRCLSENHRISCCLVIPVQIFFLRSSRNKDDLLSYKSKPTDKRLQSWEKFGHRVKKIIPYGLTPILYNFLQSTIIIIFSEPDNCKLIYVSATSNVKGLNNSLRILLETTRPNFS